MIKDRTKNITREILNGQSEKQSALLIATLSSFLTPYMSSAINIALPAIGKEFNMNNILLSWIATSFLLSASMFLLPFGRLADIYGRKKIYLYGIIIYTSSSLLSAISFSSLMLLFSRILQGIGGAMIFGTSVAILTSVFPLGERGKVLGINVAAVYAGLSVGPFLGGLLTYNFGWRSIFVLNVPLGILVIFFVLWKLKGEWAEAKGEQFDIVGSIIYVVSLPILMYGFSKISTLSGLWIFFLGTAGFAYFVVHESKIENPLLEINLFRRNIVFSFSNLAAFINYSATFAVGFILSLYLQYIKGLTPQNAGIILVSQPIIQAVFSPFAGKLSDRIEPRITASIGMTLTVIGLILLSFIGENTSFIFLIFNLMLLGFAFALFSSPNTNAIMSSVEKRFYGVASGTLGTMRLTGQMFSMGIAMLIFSIFIGNARITQANYLLFIKAIRISFVIYAVFCFAGIFASMARGKLR